MIAIDPGVHKSGWARFAFGRLTECGHDDNVFVRALILRESAVVIEKPQLDGRTTGAKIADAIDLAVEVGRFAQLSGSAQLVQPRQWKGQLKKEITRARAERALEPRELALVPKLPKTRAHNMWDAIALGLWLLKREKPTL